MKVTVIRSNRKTVAIQVNSDLSVTVRAPYSASEKDIEEILKKKEAWISRHIEKIKKTKERFEAEPTEKLTREKVIALAEEALKVIPERVEYFAKVIGVTYGKITVRNQKTRWGSCSIHSKKIRMNLQLAVKSEECVEYVLVHELCHLLEPSHNQRFYDLMSHFLPDWRERKQKLNEKV